MEKYIRGERAQRGRFSEFYQCDIDVIGDETLNIMHEAELPSVIYNIFKELDFGDFEININNRKILSGLFEELDLFEKTVEIMRTIDKIDKIGKENVIKEFEDLGIEKSKIETIINFITYDGTNSEKLEMLNSLNYNSETYKNGVQEDLNKL